MTAPSPDQLHTMNPTGRFSDRAADYLRYRPDYPVAAVDASLLGLDRARSAVADVGAGTGISARMFADALSGSSRVHAVEPNQPMRDAAAPHPRIIWHPGTAERTGLDAASIDLVVCAQAFHWFRPAEALAEFHRILRPGGRIALIWNERDDSDEATRRYGQGIRRASRDHPAEKRAEHHAALRQSPLFENFRMLTFPHAQWLDEAGLLGRARSASYVPTDGPAWDTLRTELVAVIRDCADSSGRIAIRYETGVYLAETC